ncbi:hypothetical protein [Rhizobium sp. CF142]|uniref:hypothetical protein n=1 Tax=Rhizobium sp. CF142 TaxID=1144314 RepID=UPI00026F04F0|nr:hypothetical protein [Rhizobium sp. CF142]EJJ26150.1 hypothetical protein PMI11_05605 [Rhizobium sp. CF142]
MTLLWFSIQQRSAVRQAWLASALLFSALTISGCDNLFAHHFHWFQKLTVTVDTPSGRKSGDEVIEVKAEYYAKGTYIGGAARFDIAGEAGVIEVLPGKYLFVLLRGFDQSAALTTFVSEIDLDNDFEEEKKRQLAEIGAFENSVQTSELSRDLYPVFVTFRDIADPASLVVVDPNNLAKDFGPGVRLRSVTITVSPEETIPNEVHKILPWLEVVGQQRGGVVPSKKRFESELTLAEKIRPSEFITFDRWRRD